MPYEYRMTRTIPFADTDLAGIVHFANFFRYMEDAEHAFYRSLGLSVHAATASGWIGWPRIQTACRYVRPLHFEDDVEVHLLVTERTSATIAYGFLFRRAADDPPRPLAYGLMTVACAERNVERNTLKSHDVPSSFADRIESAPDAALAQWRKGREA